MNLQELQVRVNEIIGNKIPVAFISGKNGNKMYKDLDYLVDIDFRFVILEEDGVENYSSKVFLFDMIDKKVLGNDYIIFAYGHDDELMKNKLLEKGLIQADNFMSINEIVKMFDVDLRGLSVGKTIAIWGAGNMSRFFRLRNKIEEKGLHVAFYLDSDCAKVGKQYDNLEIRHIDDLSKEERDNLFVIIGSTSISEISEELRRRGYIENKDFVTYFSVVMNAADMMRKTLYAEVVDGPVCDLPFTMANVHREGIYVCPPDWIHQMPIGASTQEDLNDVWNSLAAEIFRLSIANGTFSFCNLKLCGLMNEDEIVNINESSAYDRYVKAEYPSMVLLSHDHTCNLWCSSCRTELCAAQGKEYEYAQGISKNLENSKWLEKADKLLLAGDGEVFSSRIYRDILYSDGVTRKSVCILTNGNLLDKETFEKLQGKYQDIDIEVSIDAACKETYERLRRGGNWDKLLLNLKVLGELRSEGKIRYLAIRMVVQSSNIREMPDFVRLGKEIGVDLVRFARVRNFGSYSEEEFQEITITSSENSEGQIKEEFREVLEDPMLSDPIVGLYDMGKLVHNAREMTFSEMSQKYDNFIYL